MKVAFGVDKRRMKHDSLYLARIAAWTHGCRVPIGTCGRQPNIPMRMQWRLVKLNVKATGRETRQCAASEYASACHVTSLSLSAAAGAAAAAGTPTFAAPGTRKIRSQSRLHVTDERGSARAGASRMGQSVDTRHSALTGCSPMSLRRVRRPHVVHVSLELGPIHPFPTAQAFCFPRPDTLIIPTRP